MLTIEPKAGPLLKSLESVCRKLVSVALVAPEPPSELTRFWKLCCSESTVELEEVEVDVDELALLDDSWLIRLCKSLCSCPPP